MTERWIVIQSPCLDGVFLRRENDRRIYQNTGRGNI